jgi:nucleotide-binding universal stress UspA family protein
MAMKSILVPIPDTAVNGAAIETAIKVTKLLDGHLEGFYIETPVTPQGGAPGTLSEAHGYGSGAAAARLTEQQYERLAEERERRAQGARTEFQRLCHAQGVPLDASDDVFDLPSASWRQAQGAYAVAVKARAPAHDLMVVPSPGAAEPAREIAEQVLLDTGRPVLLAASEPASHPAEAAMIAWYPSLQAWRAVAAAVPLLGKDGRVEVVTVGKDDDGVAESRADVVRYLGWHGIAATTRVLEPISRRIGDTLLEAAAEAEAGMLVMGAYSHSRLREMLLGGVTRDVLAKATKTPVLMAH